MRLRTRLVLSGAVGLLCAAPTAAQEQEVPQFGGNDSVGNTLNEDARIRRTRLGTPLLQELVPGWFSWKNELAEDHGFAFGIDYTFGYFGSSLEAANGDDKFGGGDFRIFGSWTPYGRESGNTGSLVFKTETRHAYTDIPPNGMGFATGYAGVIGPQFADYGWGLTNLYWMQKFNDGRTTIVAGIVDSTDYLDIYALINPWTHFTNLVFTTGGGTIPAPEQGMGAAFGTAIGDRVYFVGGVADLNGDPVEQGDAFDSFFNESEFFTHIELGWTDDWENRYLNNTHVTVWHADEKDASTPSGSGANFSWAKFYDESYLPFLRVGVADEGGALLDTSVSGGVGYYFAENGDLLAFGLNWGEPSEQQFGPGLPEQISAEAFYRMQFSPNFALTFDVQYIADPALAPGESSEVIFGIRGRLNL